MLGRLKAYLITAELEENDECQLATLVFAENEEKARLAAARHVEWVLEVFEPDEARKNLNVYRAKEFDEYAKKLIKGARYVGQDALVPSIAALSEIGFFDPACEEKLEDA